MPLMRERCWPTVDLRIGNNRNIASSALLSAVGHALILALAAYVCLGTARPTQAPVPVQVKIVPEKLLKTLPVSRAGSEGPVVGKPGYGGPESDILATGIDDAAAKGIAREEDFTDLLVREKMEETAPLPDKRVAERTAQAVPTRVVRRDLVADTGTLPVPADEELSGLPEEEDLPQAFMKEMPGFTPVIAPTKADTVSYKPLRGAGGMGARGGGKGGGVSIDEYLLADLVVYRDPDDGRKYFKITVMAGKEVDRFKVMPKDVTFLMDSSLSIQSELGSYKEGLAYCLEHLGKDDTFNLVRFDASVRPLGEAPLAATPDAVSRAKEFIGRIIPSNITDVYGALAAVLAKPAARKPSYVILLSDGRPTAGLKDPRAIITRVVGQDGGTRPVFVFASGGRVNRYLVDFLAFTNRGWAEYAGQPSLDNELSTFYDKIKDPVLLAPRYRFSGVPADEVYPKVLPDFFRGVSFTIVGRYDADTDFSMQIVGEGADNMLEFVFADSFKNARDGTREIARQWAYNKIYELVARSILKGSDPAVTAEIEALQKKFDIKTPYPVK